MVITESWDEVLKEEYQKEYFKDLMQFVEEEYETHTIYPPREDIWNGFKAVPYDKVKIVILGQDPYHGQGQAHGMAFSVKPGVKIPPSLRNIYKELNQTIDFEIPSHGYLMKWAEEGVLMLNTVLTVRAGEAGSHKNKGWDKFTDAVIKKLNDRKEPIVFLLWGGPAKKKAELITAAWHKVLTAAHPSPLSAYNGFFGCDHFNKANQCLKDWGQVPVDFQINLIEV